MRIITYTTTQEDAGRPVRSVVPRRFHLGAHAFRRLKVENGILLNGQPVRADVRLDAGQVLEIHLENGAEAPAAPLPNAAPKSLIRWQDEDILIVSKAAPLATLPSRHIQTGTLREELAALLGENPEAFRYHPVNRLDKGTSGLLVIARHAHAQRLMGEQLHTGRFIREYLAVTEGIPLEPFGTIDAPIARPGTGARRIIREDGQRAVTHYRVEAVCRGRALVRLRLETGRTHQIRVHLASLGCPIAGDYLYGQALDALEGRFALHSAHLACTQPLTGQKITLDEPLPEALAALLIS